MAIVKVETIINCDIKKVWDHITLLDKFDWRSDISSIKVLDEFNFIEYTSKNYPTYFKINKIDKYNYLEYSIENDNIIGTWQGSFTKQDNQTKIVFIEDITAKKLIMKPLVKPYLIKQQNQFINDLKKALE